MMDVFAFREELISEYKRFSRSFTKIWAPDISRIVDQAYEDGRFFPDPLIQLNPSFVTDSSIEELVKKGTLDKECEKIFRLKNGSDPDGQSLRLHRHQSEAIDIAQREESYVLTTGTGSGKSLGYFVPIVDDVLRRKRAGDPCKGISAIVVYPMNALCNSQLEELRKYLKPGDDGDGKEPVTFARYTGQDKNEAREQIAKNPPDILLTNYRMLELLMTRFGEIDKALRKHAEGLRFLVLDELHTYRGRQGADVAMLIRRVRERFNDDLLCIGTSATMVSEGEAEDRNAVVAEIASKLFGVEVKPQNVITETLKRITDESTASDGPSLRRAIKKGVPANPTPEELSGHPVAAWIEQNLGLEKGKHDGKLVRTSQPLTLPEASERLAQNSDLDIELCRDFLKDFLLVACKVKNDGGRNFFAFRLHQFISGAGNAYSTLEPPGERYITLQGQQFKPNDRTKRLFTLCFCRDCGQEYFPVWAKFTDGQPVSFATRELSERSTEDEESKPGYLMPDKVGEFNPDALEKHYPENWLELRNGTLQVKYSRRKDRPLGLSVDTQGEVNVAGEGLSTWFINESFRFCLNSRCDADHSGNKNELSKLSGLSGEGRSSATTVLVLSALRYLGDTDLDQETKKLLAFIDNRQDASLQAGHFNDFIQILLLRGALIAAIRKSSDGYLTHDVLTEQVLEQLQLSPEEYATNPQSKEDSDTREALCHVLGYRLYFDLRRGWRFTNPNLEQLELLKIGYRGLMDCCRDEEEWRKEHHFLGSMTPEQRQEIVEMLLDRMRKSLCIKTIYLDPTEQRRMQHLIHNKLKEPWGLSEDEDKDLKSHVFMVPRPKPSNDRQKSRIDYVSHRSKFGRDLKYWMDRYHKETQLSGRLKFDETDYNDVVDGILRVLTTHGHVEPEPMDSDRIGYRIDSSFLEWRLANKFTEEPSASNEFFRTLYENVSRLSDGDDRLLHQLKAREHTAQVDADTRKKREKLFRKGLNSNGLPILFCSPTMELGVDISTLNTVYMRNVPPTPANYAQRSGRAGRSGQPALVVTYCAAKAPHDQYFFSDPTRIVVGAVNPPTINLANEDLIRSHLQAVWLAGIGVNLGHSVSKVIDREKPAGLLPLHDEIAEQIGGDQAVKEAKKRAQRILETLKQDLSGQSAPWYTGTWLANAMDSMKIRFDKAFDRWRSLYRATARQMASANEVINTATSTEKNRKEAKDSYDEAYAQHNLLLDSKSNMDADFNIYRYLAAEGFLPGYNFPRLPLMAFIPGRREKAYQRSFLSRPRFLGLTEFGPQSIIYHEGSKYRVRRTIRTIRDEANAATLGDLPVQVARICPNCGYGHFEDQKQSERCVSCSEVLQEGRKISNLYRIEQVSTRRATRITSDEEERQRQGYEMITTFRFSKTEEDGKQRIKDIALVDKNQTLLELRYGPATTLWRINLGWRGRKNKSIYGFSVNANTGEWAKNPEAPTDTENDAVQEGKTTQRVTPFVEDTKNALIIWPKIDLSDKAKISLQYALKRGIEQAFQLEEAELAAEPLPDQNNRAAVLFYEAAEGGAGVLNRLVSDPGAIARVTRNALNVCHYISSSDDYTSFSDLVNQEDECEAGCYRCLLSYYNQMEHPKIDRRDPDMLKLLCRLTHAKIENLVNSQSSGDSFDELMNISTSGLEKEWLKYVKEHGYRLPDRGQHYLREFNTRPDFDYTARQTLVYIDGPHHEDQGQKHLDAQITQRLEEAGYTVVRFTTDRSLWRDIMDKYTWLFGQGTSPAAS